MKTYYRYLYKELITISLLTIGVLTFFLVILNVFRQVSDYLNRDVPILVIGQMIMLLVPFVLQFTLPWGLLMAVLLLFGRLSQDNELLTLKSSGIGLGPIIAPVIILSLIFSGISFWINASLAPESRMMFKAIGSDMLRNNPMALFTANQVIDKFPGYRIFIGQRHGNEIEQIHIWQIDSDYHALSHIRANRAIVTPDLENERLLLTLFDARQEILPKDHLEDYSRVTSGSKAREFPMQIDLGPMFKSSQEDKSVVNQTLGEIGTEIFQPSNLLRNLNVTPMLTEIQKRIAWSLSSFTFVLVGIPLALQTQRRETSMGVALSLVIVLLYYAVFIVAESMKQQARFFPELIIWLPNLVFQALGFLLLFRANRR